jgi:3-oxoacyl-[acyl-carrier protein] reductase
MQLYLRQASRAPPMLRIDDLQNKLVLVTGGSTGIGAAVSRAFAEQRAKVAVHWNNNAAAANTVVRDIEAAGGSACLVRGDLTQRGGAKGIVEEAIAALGGLDILINNAGALLGRVPILDGDEAWMESVISLNAKSVIGTVQAAVPAIERRGGGAIINVGSIAGLDGGGPGTGVYGAAKAFVHNMTRHLARELAGRGIRVNAVSPGVVDTPFHAATPPERMEAMRKSVHLGRVGQPADCVGAFLFLASPQLSGYITGQNIHVNGGQVMP